MDTMAEMGIKRAPPMVRGASYHLRLKDDLSAVVKDDPEATRKIAANHGFMTKHTNDGGTYACIAKLGYLHFAQVCRGKDMRCLIGARETQITVRWFAIGQKTFGEAEIAIKTGIEKRLKGVTSLVDHNSDGNLRIPSAG
jgi:hypothetical protein